MPPPPLSSEGRRSAALDHAVVEWARTFGPVSVGPEDTGAVRARGHHRPGSARTVTHGDV
ncbi:hypothetical protein PWG71_03720 [Nocardiopsis sp. N85]|uniref:hypothetical protein n=1 Tax=Nocardiopsis sp. N85 TaxID=3029400 RepID=UPI00237F3484|nr:hypothetical protein [Nocardiopsis sp. N85]MDE3720483.1 hypothetical protein [Nocardiopsis sp. N85]